MSDSESESNKDAIEVRCDLCRDIEDPAFSGYGTQLESDEFCTGPYIGYCMNRFYSDYLLTDWPVEDFKKFVQAVKDRKPYVVTLHGSGYNSSLWPKTGRPVINKNGYIRYGIWEWERNEGECIEPACPCLIQRLDDIVKKIDKVLTLHYAQTNVIA